MNTPDTPDKVLPAVTKVSLNLRSRYQVPPRSLTVIRVAQRELRR
jgi:hypothetical protein